MHQESQIVEALCPACGHCVAARFFDGGEKPLATLAWPMTRDAAASLRQYPLDFVQCVRCTHVFNRKFNYSDVPYSTKPNLMFNKGRNWSAFVESLLTRLAKQFSASSTIVEIGHGDGSFLRALGRLAADSKFIGFDPHGVESSEGNLSFKSEYFVPARDIPELRPTFIITRHVLEHLANPRAFLQQVSFNATSANQQIRCYFEVPCIDHVFRTGRTVDFYYEHSSHFSTRSFSHMLQTCTLSVDEIGHGYNEEVIYGFVTLGAPMEDVARASAAQDFNNHSLTACVAIQQQLDELIGRGRCVAIWGGTGKSAAFMNRYGLDRERFPVVVDSDAEKVGTFVPGTAQVICSPQTLVGSNVDTIIIPPQWRARDIAQEIANLNVHPKEILIEHAGMLVEFREGKHPY